jgi:YebC/PmpR family DNA-binding regulatory protein
MSGHSKWSTIKHKKAKTDAQKGKAFSKVSREIIMAVKLGGKDPEMNPRLRLALQKAKEVNMPNDNVNRAIIKGAGDDTDSNLEEVTYEAYGPHGVALLIETLTENKNRTVPNIRAILTRNNGSLATTGAVSYLFNKKGLFIFSPNTDENQIIELGLEHGAEDVETKEDKTIELITDPTDFDAVKTAFDSQSIPYEVAQLTMIPSTSVLLPENDAKKVISLIEMLEEDDDIQEVYANLDIQQ